MKNLFNMSFGLMVFTLAMSSLGHASTAELVIQDGVREQSRPSSFAIPQEVSEIKTKPMDVLQTNEGMKKLSLLQKQYRENLVRRSSTAKSSTPRRVKMTQKKVQLAE